MDRVRKGRKLVYLNGILIRLALSPISQDHYGSHIRTDRAAMNAALLPGLLQPLIYRGWMDGWMDSSSSSSSSRGENSGEGSVGEKSAWRDSEGRREGFRVTFHSSNGLKRDPHYSPLFKVKEFSYGDHVLSNTIHWNDELKFENVPLREKITGGMTMGPKIPKGMRAQTAAA